jgi:hypothetical protein
VLRIAAPGGLRMLGSRLLVLRLAHGLWLGTRCRSAATDSDEPNP